MFTYIACLLFCICFVLVFFYSKERQRRRLENKALEREVRDARRQIEKTEAEKAAMLNEQMVFSNQLTEQKTINQTLEKQLAEQLLKQKELLQENRFQFEQLSNKLLEEKAEKFAKQNQHNLDILLKPLQQRIKDFEKKVEDTYHRESNERFSLKNELKRTFELNQTLSEQANNLTKALRADSKKQGNWGEYLLERILETAGLQENLHYRKQVSFPGEQGVLRPDVVLYLPEQKHIIIDAKLSLTAYERYFNADEEVQRQMALQDHIRSVKKHIDELGRKKYERLVADAPDFVLMFVPIEPAYSLALMKEPELYDNAFRKKVILVSVSSLLATLRVIESIWRLEKQNKNAHLIIEEGNRLYEKLAGFVSDMETMGQKLSGVQHAFDQAMNKLKTGRGNLIRRAEKMKHLGLNPAKQLPVHEPQKEEE